MILSHLNNTITVYPGSTPGPTILISCLVHGNEIVGECVLTKAHNILSHGTHCGTYIILLANAEAYRRGIRYCDEDMNRCRGRRDQANTIETKRVKEIIDRLEANNYHPDYVYDIHSTPSKSDPMIICDDTPLTRHISGLFDIPYRVCGLIKQVDGVSLLSYFMQRYQSEGIAFEAGDHTSTETMQQGEKIVQTIINYHNGVTTKKNNQTQISVMITDLYYTSDPACRFSHPYQGFETIPAHTIRCIDNNQVYTTQQEKIIVIPNTRIAQDLEQGPRTWIAYLADRITS